MTRRVRYDAPPSSACDIMRTMEPKSYSDEAFTNTKRHPQRREVAALLMQQRVTAALRCRHHHRLAWRWLAVAVGAFLMSTWPVLPGSLRVVLFLFSIVGGVVVMNHWGEASSEALIVETLPADVTKPSVTPTRAQGLLPSLGIFFGFRL